MRIELLRPLLLALLLGATPAAATAELLEFEGRIRAVLPTLEDLELASGVGVARVDDLEIGEIEIVAAFISGSAGIPITDPTAAPVTSIRLSASLARGMLGIDPAGGSFGQPTITSPVLPMRGEIQVCMLVAPLPPCIGGFALPLSQSSGQVGVGVGGLITFGGSATFRVSLHAAPFTLNTAYASGVTLDGAPFTVFSAGSVGGPLSFTSTAGQPGGFLSVVTPTRVVGYRAGEPQDLVPGILRLEIDFVPEPGAALLLAAGALGLLLLRRDLDGPGADRET